MKLVYIAHPYTSYGDPNINYKLIHSICQDIIATEPDIVPISPVHAFQFTSPTGDQEVVLQMCEQLLLRCDEVRFYGKWGKSTGCRRELHIAYQAGIPIRMYNVIEPNALAACGLLQA